MESLCVLQGTAQRAFPRILFLFLWENAKGPGSLGDPARGIPTLLDPVQAEEHHEPGPLPPFEPGPTPPILYLFGKGKGQGVPAREGVPARGFLEL